jgi:predicted nuclease of predicted toxin-antitoxin system
MNLTPRWVPYLAGAGHEAVHWCVVGDIAAEDRVICGYARELKFVLVTSDLDFPQILAHTSESSPSVILLRGEPLTPEFRGAALLNLLDVCRADLEKGAIVTLDWSERARARLLPLR